MYDRGVKNLPPRQSGGLRYRIETLVGITGVKMAKYRATWYEALSVPFKVVWRPHLLSILVFEVLILHNTKNARAVKLNKPMYRASCSLLTLVSSYVHRNVYSETSFIPSSGYEFGHFCHSETPGVRIFSRWNRRHVCYANGCVPILGSLHGRSSESTA